MWEDNKRERERERETVWEWEDIKSKIVNWYHDSGPTMVVVGIMEQYNEMKKQITKFEKESDIEYEVQQRKLVTLTA